MDVSALEQDMTTSGDHSSSLQRVSEMLRATHVDDFTALRLVLLYALRFHGNTSNQIARLQQQLRDRGVPQVQVNLVDAILSLSTASMRSSDLFGARAPVSSLTRALMRELRGVSNVFTQHRPLLAEILDGIVKGKGGRELQVVSGAPTRERPQEIIVFIVGGITFEEAAFVAKMNVEARGQTCVLLGGTSILNSKSFLNDVSVASGGTPIFDADTFRMAAAPPAAVAGAPPAADVGVPSRATTSSAAAAAAAGGTFSRR
jgi:vacuolar protein sorting-associated protein 45